VLEIILVDVEVPRDRLEDLEAGAIEGREQLEERVLEAGNLSRPEVVRHMVAEAVALRQVAADVPEFLEVMRLVSLGCFDAERRVTARPAAAGDEILALHLLGQREEGFRLV